MKKWQKQICLFSVGLLLTMPVVAKAYGGNEQETYAYVSEKYLSNALFNLQEEALSNDSKELFEKYKLFKIEDLNKIKGQEGVGIEADPSSLVGMNHLINLEHYNMDGTNAVDYRPLEDMVSLKSFVDWGAPTYSIDFLRNMKQLEYLNLNIDNKDSQDLGSSLRPIHDLSVLNNLNKLTTIKVTEDRASETVYLKKAMKEYQLVNPIVLSNQFGNAEVEITSTNSNFIYEDEVMTWTDLTDDEDDINYVEELNYSWNVVVNNSTGHFSYTGTTVIPLVWK